MSNHRQATDEQAIGEVVLRIPVDLCEVFIELLEANGLLNYYDEDLLRDELRIVKLLREFIAANTRRRS